LSAGLYLHIPFCSAICPYCDFAVLTGGPERRERFTEHLISEIGLWSGNPADIESFRGIDTVYFGGGTPSALSPEQLGRIVESVKAGLPLVENAEDAWIFFEANPEDVTPESVRAWRELGVRTLSVVRLRGPGLPRPAPLPPASAAERRAGPGGRVPDGCV
jgi:oxygen-independent coproporphyrinogen-3 oxidase